MECPSKKTITMFLVGGLSAQQEQSCCDHLAQCAECQDLADRLSDDVELRRRFRQRPLHHSFADSVATAELAADLYSLVTPGPRSGDQPVGPQGPLPRELGDFRIRREIGRGGMAVVYEAEQLSLQRCVALKVLSLASLLDARHLERFRNEALAAASLEHPNIVDIYAVSQDRGVHYFAMKLIEGHDLSQILVQLRRRRPASTMEPRRFRWKRVVTELAGRQPAAPSQSAAFGQNLCRSEAMDGVGRQGDQVSSISGTQLESNRSDTAPFAQLDTPLDMTGNDYYRRVAERFKQVAESLEYAHQRGIVHRDVKPSNLMLDRHGKIWVTDFGLAHIESAANLTHTGDLLGTLRYMSPEQAGSGRPVVDPRSDIYSLGATLYEMLSLVPAFSGNDRQKLLRQIIEDEPPALSQVASQVPQSLETIVAKAMNKEPGLRYQSAQALADDLRRFVEDKPIHAKPPTAWHKTKRWVRRHKEASVAAVVCLCLLVFAVGGSLYREHFLTRAALERERALHHTAHYLRRQAEQSELESRVASYISDMNLASHAMHSGDYRQAVKILSRARPASGKPDPRGFAWNYLWRQTRPPYCQLPAHADGVSCVQFSPDGQWLATAGKDGTIRVCNAQERELDKVLSSGSNWFGTVAFSPDAQALASIDVSGMVRVWDLNEGRQMWAREAHEACNHAPQIVWIGDGSQLASSGGEPIIRVWDRSTGQLQHEMRGHRDTIHALAICPQRNLLASGAGGGDRTIMLWDVETGDRVGVFRGHTRRLTSLAFSPDGKWLASGSTDRTARIWNLETRKGGRVLEQIDEVRSLRFSPDSETLAYGRSDGVIGMWWMKVHQAETSWRVRRSMQWYGHSGRVDALAFSPDGKELVSCDDAGGVRSWSPWENAVAVNLNDDRSGGPIGDATFSADSRQLITAQKKGLFYWDLTTNTRATVLEAPERRRTSLTLTANGHMAAIAGKKGIIGIWDLADGSLKRRLQVGGRKSSFSRGRCAFAPNGRWLAVPNWQEDTIWLFDTRSWQRVAALPAPQCNDAVFTPDSKYLVGDVQNEILVWDIESKQVHKRLGAHANTVRDLALSPDGRLLASAGNDRRVKLFDLKSGEETRSFVGHRDQVWAVAFSPDGRFLVSGARNGSLRVWHLASGRHLCEMARLSAIKRLRFSPDGRYLACVRSRGRVLLLDLAVPESQKAGKAENESRG